MPLFRYRASRKLCSCFGVFAPKVRTRCDSRKVPIQLDKILLDIASEKVLHPKYPDASKKDVDDAWLRVGKNNKLSVHEARSIFKVLQKKYEQEKGKEKSAWKLFDIMDEIHTSIPQKGDAKSEVGDDEELPMEEDEEYEMLDVQEDEEHNSMTSNPIASDGESPSKSVKSSNSSNESPEKDEKSIKPTSAAPEEKKLLNTMASASPRPAVPMAMQAQVTAANLQKKGITMKKTTPGVATPRATTKSVASTPNSANASNTSAKMSPGFVKIIRPGDATNIKQESPQSRSSAPILESGKTIQLPESIKRKLNEEQVSQQNVKKINLSQSAKNSSSLAIGSPATPNSASTQSGSVQIKQEQDVPKVENVATQGINLITIPANTNGLINGSGVGGPTSSTAATVASTSTNGYSPRIEEMDFRNDIIFDSGIPSAGNVSNGKTTTLATNVDMINLGNFDNSLPPTFFKNLCNSSRHEALGLYVANVMNRLRPRSAAKLELGILRAIIDVQTDEFED